MSAGRSGAVQKQNTNNTTNAPFRVYETKNTHNAIKMFHSYNDWGVVPLLLHTILLCQHKQRLTADPLSLPGEGQHLETVVCVLGQTSNGGL